MKKDFINHFRKDSKHLDKSTETKPHTPAKNPEVEIAKEMINAYRKHYQDIDLDVLRNLIELKDITNAPKQANPDASFNAIEQRLGEAESNETLRRERWHNKISCPNCGSHRIRNLNHTEQKAHGNFRYNCLECNQYFNASTGTPIESGSPPLSTWMFCWYLLGCTDSLQYIANKLGLDLPTVEAMVRQMQKLFKSQQPLTHFMSFEEWSLKHGTSYKKRIQHEFSRKQELYRGDTTGVPHDTREYARQKNRAHNPHDHTPHKPKPKNRAT
jgi:transposase-like protein